MVSKTYIATITLRKAIEADDAQTAYDIVVEQMASLKDTLYQTTWSLSGPPIITLSVDYLNEGEELDGFHPPQIDDPSLPSFAEWIERENRN